MCGPAAAAAVHALHSDDLFVLDQTTLLFCLEPVLCRVFLKLTWMSFWRKKR
jgi:hypothetical protein